MSLWREIFDPVVADTDEILRHDPVPEGMLRLHVFAGNFPSEEAALAYCYDTPDDIHPEPLTSDLPEAMIDTNFVDVGFGADVALAIDTFFDEPDRSVIRRGLEGCSTIVVISEFAFRGLPYALSATPMLAYLGPFLIKAR